MKNNFLLLSTILRGMWLMESRTANAYLPAIKQLLMGEKVTWFDDDDDDRPVAYAVSMANGILKRVNDFDQADPGSVAIIPIQGAIMKEDNCGAAGTASMGAIARIADNHPSIVAHVLHLDTGGGAVDGTFEFADILSGLQKPLVAWVDGMAASAGYAIAVRAKHIMLSHKTAELGSIGTAIRFTDYSKMYEERGVKLHNIRATDSTQKNEDFFQALEGNYGPLIENILDPTNQVFLDSVRLHRNGKLKEGSPEKGTTAGEPLNGQMYLAERAIELGLADSIGTLEQAVAMAQGMTNGLTRSVSPSNLNNMHKIKMAWTSILAFLGNPAPAAGQEYVETQISDETLEKLNGEMTRLQSENQTLTTQVSQIRLELETAKNDAAAWKMKADEYGHQPGALPTNPWKTGEKQEEIEDPNAYIANLPHNRALDGNPLFAAKAE